MPAPTLTKEEAEVMPPKRSSVVPAATLKYAGADAVRTLEDPATVVTLLIRTEVALMISVMKLLPGMFVPVTT